MLYDDECVILYWLNGPIVHDHEDCAIIFAHDAFYIKHHRIRVLAFLSSSLPTFRAVSKLASV